MKLRLLVLALALAAFAFSLWELRLGSDGVAPQRVSIGTIPATVFAPPQGAAKAVVVVAHGFAGSQQMMAPLATSLARDGYLAITFDFAGHGRNAAPMHGGVVDLESSMRQLLGEIDAIAAYAKARPDYKGRLAFIGHSMASELIVQAAQRRDDVNAVVAISLFGRTVTATSPRNLLVIDGAWEFAALKDAARRIVGLTHADPQEDVTYGDFAAGTARRFGFARGAEHIGVIWSVDAAVKAREWLDDVFAATPTGEGIDRRGPWLGLMGLAAVALMGVGVRGLPRLRNEPAPAPLSGWRFYALVGGAAVLTPLILWKFPTDFLPILLGDYLAAHFALWGALLGLGSLALRARSPRRGDEERLQARGSRSNSDAGFTALAVALLAGLYLLLFGAPLDLYVTSFWPTGPRWPLVPLEIAAVALAFAAEERLARGLAAPRLGYTTLKLGFVISLIAAIALNPQRLFFLAIVAPVVAILFVGFGFINRAAYKRTLSPYVGALGTAVALGVAIAVTFPMVD